MKKAKKSGKEPSHSGREKTLRKAVYGSWFKEPKQPSHTEGGGYSGGYGSNSFNGGGNSFNNSFKGGKGNPQKKGNGKRMERSKWLRMYWARKNSKGR